MDGYDTFREIVSPLARFASFTANAILFGLVPVLLLIVRPGFEQLSSTWDRARSAVSERLEALIEGALLTSAFATFFLVIVQALQIAAIRGTEADGSAFAAVFDSSYGTWLGFRAPLLIALAVLLVGTVRRIVLGASGRLLWAVWGLLGAALLATNTFSGHAAVATPRGLSEANDLLHLISGATWFAGIVVLAWVLPVAWPKIAEADQNELLAPVVIRFSKLAMVAIAVVAVTGTINSFLHVGHLGDLIDTGYGRTIVVKIVLLTAILGLGGVNHYVVRRRLERAATDGQSTRRLFRKTIVAELAVGIAIMAATGLLTDLGRTREAAAVPSSPVATTVTLEMTTP